MIEGAGDDAGEIVPAGQLPQRARRPVNSPGLSNSSPRSRRGSSMQRFRRVRGVPPVNYEKTADRSQRAGLVRPVRLSGNPLP